MTKEALRLALEALKDNQHLVADNERHSYVMVYNGIIEKCEEALAQPEQEPVAYYHPQLGFYWTKPTKITAPTIVDVEPLPLYTTPPKQEPEPDALTVVYMSGVFEGRKLEREALKAEDWTTIMRYGSLVTWGDAEELGERVRAAIRARGNT